MTIAALLSHLGIQVPRYVTVDGLVVGGVVPPSVTGTQVKPARFHGGEDPVRRDGTPWWIADPAAAVADVTDMASRFPHFMPVRDQDEYVWIGTIDTGRGRFPIRVAHHTERSLPTITVPGRRLGRSKRGLWQEPPHTYLSGALCVAGVDDWDATDTTSTAVAWAAQWLAAYTQWRTSGTWPTPGHDRAVR